MKDMGKNHVPWARTLAEEELTSTARVISTSLYHCCYT
jgi:hypothetical protein